MSSKKTMKLLSHELLCKDMRRTAAVFRSRAVIDKTTLSFLGEDDIQMTITFSEGSKLLVLVTSAHRYAAGFLEGFILLHVRQPDGCQAASPRPPLDASDLVSRQIRKAPLGDSLAYALETIASLQYEPWAPLGAVAHLLRKVFLLATPLTRFVGRTCGMKRAEGSSVEHIPANGERFDAFGAAIDESSAVWRAWAETREEIEAAALDLERYGYGIQSTAREAEKGGSVMVEFVCSFLPVEEVDPAVSAALNFVASSRVEVTVKWMDGFRTPQEWLHPSQMQFAVRVVQDKIEADGPSLVQPEGHCTGKDTSDGGAERQGGEVFFPVLVGLEKTIDSDLFELAGSLTKGRCLSVASADTDEPSYLFSFLEIEKRGGEQDEKDASEGNIALLAVRWVKRELALCFTKCIYCRVNLPPLGMDMDVYETSGSSRGKALEHTTSHAGAISAQEREYQGLPAGKRHLAADLDHAERDAKHNPTWLRVCHSDSCAEYLYCGEHHTPSGRARGIVEAEILRCPLAADLLLSLAYVAIGFYVGRDGSPEFCGTLLDPGPCPLSGINFEQFADSDGELNLLPRSNIPRLAMSSYREMKEALDSLPPVTQMHSVCWHGGHLEGFLLKTAHEKAYKVLRWVLLTGRKFQLKFLSNQSHHIRKVSAAWNEPHNWSLNRNRGFQRGRNCSRGLGDFLWQEESLSDGYPVQFSVEPGCTDREKMFIGSKVNRDDVVEHSRRAFGFHGSSLERWHSILHNHIDFAETVNSRAGGDGCYISPTLSHASWYTYSQESGAGGFGMGSTSCACWAQSVLGVKSIVGVFEFVDNPASRAFIHNSRYGTVLGLNSNLALRFLLCKPRYGFETKRLASLFPVLASAIPARVSQECGTLKNGEDNRSVSGGYTIQEPDQEVARAPFQSQGDEHVRRVETIKDAKFMSISDCHMRSCPRTLQHLCLEDHLDLDASPIVFNARYVVARKDSALRLNVGTTKTGTWRCEDGHHIPIPMPIVSWRQSRGQREGLASPSSLV